MTFTYEQPEWNNNYKRHKLAAESLKESKYTKLQVLNMFLPIMKITQWKKGENQSSFSLGYQPTLYRETNDLHQLQIEGALDHEQTWGS